MLFNVFSGSCTKAIGSSFAKNKCIRHSSKRNRSPESVSRNRIQHHFKYDEANKRVRLPKFGWMPCRFTQHIDGKPNSVTVRWNGRKGKDTVASLRTRPGIAEDVGPRRKYLQVAGFPARRASKKPRKYAKCPS